MEFYCELVYCEERLPTHCSVIIIIDLRLGLFMLRCMHSKYHLCSEGSAL